MNPAHRERRRLDPLAHLPYEIRRAIEITPAAGTRERIVDITTTGRRTGLPRRIEIFFYRANGATYLCSGAGAGPTDWYANLRTNPTFTFHLKNGIRADLPAHATIVTDPTERAAVIAAIVDDLNQPHDPGTIRPTRLQDWSASRLIRIDFD
ncbi:nitroreductase/quinone reductase family protein [Verrucosispora sioxanthis]|uniref:Nitroreductase family deazaflavin-dependent oxidoreductase n=1 Tax=Verrucosispora sioxanthis TaxID=2499994 RepID=A0A6M1LC13_9ACTN|nr:nitroreductase/quinone reductase family protein [Verrucosispora sioxanthis]NEE66728.1 nitroreductase family deazaflavin-dependent oxidoreductase [Verrucosispora sioxanthis]NGM15838.1 nitroreductase family deazaflavin-dependent oxidoreductase [Verrucosispora sioxanthis]